MDTLNPVQFSDHTGAVRDLTAGYHYAHPSGHAQMMGTYRDARHAFEENRENGDNMRLEDYEYKAKNTPPTVKQFMRAR